MLLLFFRFLLMYNGVSRGDQDEKKLYACPNAAAVSDIPHNRSG